MTEDEIGRDREQADSAEVWWVAGGGYQIVMHAIRVQGSVEGIAHKAATVAFLAGFEARQGEEEMRALTSQALAQPFEAWYPTTVAELVERCQTLGFEVDVSLIDQRARAEKAEERVQELERAFAQQNHDLEQILGKALGYPPLPADWNTTDVCTGDHVPESLAMEAAQRIQELEQAIREAPEPS